MPAFRINTDNKLDAIFLMAKVVSNQSIQRSVEIGEASQFG